MTILPRRGVRVERLTPEDVRHLYEVVGALEGAALLAAFPHIGEGELSTLHRLNEEMKDAVLAGDFDRYYDRNLAFHDVFLDRCGNDRLVRLVRSHKQRLYDWPRRRGLVKEWELRSLEEHGSFLRLVAEGDAQGAADHLRDVHWSFPVQEGFIHRYYFADQGDEA